MKDATITKTYKGKDIWDAVVGFDFANMRYWVQTVDYEGWQEPCDITLQHQPKDGGEELQTSTVTPDQLVDAYAFLVANNWTHCGGYSLRELDEADSCLADLVIQQAIFGEQVFG